MTDLYFTDSAYNAAVHLLANTPLGTTLGIDSARVEGSALVLTIDAMRYEMLSSGERALLGILEMLANHRSTVTLHDLTRLDDDCRAAVIEAYRIYLRVPGEVAA